MQKINLYEAKTHLSKIVAAVEESGVSVVLCRNGRPVADLVPHQKFPANLKPHELLKGASYAGDPCETLPESDWPESLR